VMWSGIGLNFKLRPDIIRNIGQVRSNGVTAARYIYIVLRPYMVSFFHDATI